MIIIIRQTWLVCVLFVTVGCSSNGANDKHEQVFSTKRGPMTEITPELVCKVLVRDLRFDPASSMKSELLQGKLRHGRNSPVYLVESSEGQMSFNLEEMTFTIVRGINHKTGAPHEIRGILYFSEGELKARFGEGWGWEGK